MRERAAEARNAAIGQLSDYSGTLAEREALAGVLDDNGDDGHSWVRRRHDEQLLELGRQLRDAFPEGEARHAVAQVIQRELLEAERRLKFALKPSDADLDADD
jgi:hypothetical protein